MLLHCDAGTPVIRQGVCIEGHPWAESARADLTARADLARYEESGRRHLNTIHRSASAEKRHHRLGHPRISLEDIVAAMLHDERTAPAEPRADLGGFRR